MSPPPRVQISPARCHESDQPSPLETAIFQQTPPVLYIPSGKRHLYCSIRFLLALPPKTGIETSIQPVGLWRCVFMYTHPQAHKHTHRHTNRHTQAHKDIHTQMNSLPWTACSKLLSLENLQSLALVLWWLALFAKTTTLKKAWRSRFSHLCGHCILTEAKRWAPCVTTKEPHVFSEK